MATIKISIIEARHLPIMDRATSLADAYVIVKINDAQEHTMICPKTRNPVWRKDLRFDVPDLEALQEDPVEVRLYDHDTFSRDDMIGSVFVDLNCLLQMEDPRPSMRQWFPVFDTLSGLRGELLMSVKLRFSTRNPFVPSLPLRTLHGLERSMPAPGASLSTEVEGVFIFSMSRLDPSVFRIETVFAMVEELLVRADPEQSTLTSLRSSRTTYEARMVQLFKLSGKVRRQLSRKVLGLGCNCVLGYRESFDFEGMNGMIVRAYGTPCTISRVDNALLNPQHTPRSPRDPDGESPPPEDGGGRLHTRALRDITKLTRTQVALVTMRHLPPGVLLSIGGTVAARSVKVVSKHRQRATMLQERDVWWNELRDEVKANASALRCNAVIAYTEEAEYYEDCALMSVTGTAVVVDSRWRAMHLGPEGALALLRKRAAQRRLCALLHARPPTAATAKCGLCGRRLVPDVIIASCEPPNELSVHGSPKLIEVRAVRVKPDVRTVDLALAISQVLPHLEYRLHQQLLFKLKMWGLNAAFQLRIKVSVTDRLIVATANATAMCVVGLPTPVVPSLHVLDRDVSRAPIVQRLQGALSEMERFASGVSEPGPSDRQPSRRRSTIGTPLVKTKLPSKQHTPEPVDGEASPIEEAGGESTAADEFDGESGSRGREPSVSGSENVAAERATFQVEIDDVEDAEGMLGIFDGVPHADMCFFSLPCIHGEPNMFQTGQQVVLQRRYCMADVPVSLHMTVTEYVSHCVGDARKSLLYKLHRFACAMGTDCVVLSYRNETSFTPVLGDLHVRLSGVFASLAATSTSRITLLEEAARAATERLAAACETSSSSDSSSSDDSSASSLEDGAADAESEESKEQSPGRQPNRALYIAATAPFTLPFVMQRGLSALDHGGFSGQAMAVATSMDVPIDSGMLPPPTPMLDIPLFPETIAPLPQAILFTPLSFVPGRCICKYIGRVSQHFIREARVNEEEDDESLGSFLSSTVFEVHAVVTAIVAALGGDALIDYKATFHEMYDSDGSSTGYLFLTVTGHAVTTSSDALVEGASVWEEVRLPPKPPLSPPL